MVLVEIERSVQDFAKTHGLYISVCHLASQGEVQRSRINTRVIAAASIHGRIGRLGRGLGVTILVLDLAAPRDPLCMFGTGCCR